MKQFCVKEKILYKFDISFVLKLKAINYKQKTFPKFTQKVYVSYVLYLRSLQN